ncbi:hypothetical protein [Cupriavidus taiwanensis]|uniref:hypothetical protein n=1 Tax=Cupriavidus taiwanensis TaxID=164546 RepID=UPI0011C124A4|nr:hypothetical protein [Cupriavidus taiwanensis]
MKQQTRSLPSISAKELADVIRTNINEFDWTLPTDSITRYLEQKSQKRVTFSALVLAMLMCQFAAAPHGRGVRFVSMKDVAAAQ